MILSSLLFSEAFNCFLPFGFVRAFQLLSLIDFSNESFNLTVKISLVLLDYVISMFKCRFLSISFNRLYILGHARRSGIRILDNNLLFGVFSFPRFFWINFRGFLHLDSILKLTIPTIKHPIFHPLPFLRDIPLRIHIENHTFLLQEHQVLKIQMLLFFGLI